MHSRNPHKGKKAVPTVEFIKCAANFVENLCGIQRNFKAYAATVLQTSR